MSLECEGHGAACEVCGHFDFLPTECPQCHRLLCQQHVRRHPPAPDSTEWCDRGITGHNPHDLTQASDTAGGGGDRTGATRTPERQCYVCGSEWCVLCPCPTCEQCFCAAHRFHGHEDTVDAARRRKPRVSAQPSASATVEDGEATVGTAAKDAEADDWLAQTCRPFTPAASLVLAPPQYRSRMMPGTVLVIHLPPPTAATADAPMPARVGVCSLSLATEATIGQLVERLVHALALWRLDTADGAAELSEDARQTRAVQHAHPFKIEGDTAVDPPLRLAALPLGSTARAVLSPQDVLCVSVETAPTSPTDRRAAVGAAVFVPLKSPSRKRDVRLHALATRLRLRTATAATAAGAGVASSTAPTTTIDGHATTVAEEDAPPAELAAAAPTTTTCEPVETGSSPWPFRTPAPLTAFVFANHKGSPYGREAVSDAASAVTVAVFVEDVDLPVAVPPFCCVLSRAWSLGRVMDQIARGVAHMASAVPAERIASTTCELWWLNEAGPNPDAALQRVTASDTPGTKSLATLKNGDVLFCGRIRPSSSGVSSAVQAEVNRLREAKGKEQTALRMTMMKQCVVM